MGLLDSNRVKTQELEQTGVFSLDLSASGIQNNTNFNSIAYKTLKFVISGIDSGADVIINVKSGISGDYQNSPIYNSDGVQQGSAITTNGTYYADVSCSDGYYFKLNRRLESGTATVKWCLTQEPIPGKVVNKTLLSIIPYVVEQDSSDDETLDLSTVKNVKTVATNDNFKCIVVHVSSISANAKLSVLTTALGNLVFYRNTGELLTAIENTGVYYIPVSNIFSSVIIRNTVAVTGGSATLRIGFLNEVPQDVVNMKPIQEIASNTVSASNSTFTVIPYDAAPNIWKYFKYYFVSFIITNNGAATRTVTLSAQPYFIRANGTKTGGKLEEISVSDTYTNTTAWQEVKSNYGVRLYMQFESYTEGDTVECHVFGVR